MPVTTVEVITTLCYADGTPAEGVCFVAELQSPSQTTDGYIVAKTIKSVVNDLGEVSLNLWPNDNGVVDTYYRIYAEDKCLGRLLDTVVVVPESTTPLELEDIAMPINSLSLGQSSGNVASIRRVDTLEGIIGGGDLSTNRTHKLDLTTISTEQEFPTGDWVVAVQDPTQPDNIRYAKLGNLPGLGFDTIENSVATVGQTEIFIEQLFTPGANQLDVFINGVYQCPGEYIEDLITGVPPFEGKITLSEGLEGGEDICIKIKQNSPFALSLDAANVTYSGGGSVEDALNTLFSVSGASPWQETSGDYLASSGDRLFVSTDTGSLVITLPSSPNVGDTINIIDVTSAPFVGIGNDLNNSFTIARNGNNIMEIPDDLEVDQAKVSLEFIFTGTTIGWVFSE